MAVDPQHPTKLSPEMTEKIVAAIKTGAPISTACIVAGIGRTTFYTWQKQAEEDRSAGKETEHTRFLSALEDAQEELKIELLQIVKLAAPRDWRAARDMLRMRYPETFNRARTEHTGRDGGPITGNVLVLTEEVKD